MDESFSVIPHSITASTRDGLTTACLENSLRDKRWYRYFDIQQAKEKGKDVWVAWYFKDVSFKNFPRSK
jgi:hypothetical protein